MQEVAVLEPREIVITTEQTDLIKRTICQGATDAEMKLFFFDCQRRGVHPLDKLIHFTKRSNKYTPITSIDFMRQRAHASQVFAGEEEPVYEIGNDGLPDTCKYIVYRLVNGQRFPWTATARWNEYYPGDQLGFMWKKMPMLMLAKCAEALALRKAFPAELQGLYVKEEMDQAGPEQKPLRKPSDILRDSERPPEPLDSVEQHTVGQGEHVPPGVNQGPLTPYGEVVAAWRELLAVSETVREASQTGNRIEQDETVDVLTKTQLREEVKQKILQLRAKKG